MQNHVRKVAHSDLTDQVATELIHGLVAIPSLSRHEKDAVEWLVKQMCSLGFDKAFRDESGNAVGIIECPDADGKILETGMLLGHIDTVPGEIPVRLQDGILHGRGSVDAKGSLATFVMAAARCELPPGQRLIVVGAVEEEITTSRGARYISENYQPDWCIIGEPSGAEAVTLGYKGRWHFRASFVQSAAHSAGPQVAIAEKAVAWWLPLKDWANEFNKDKSRIFEQLQITLDQFQTGADGIRESVVAQVGLRLPVGFPKDDFHKVVEGALAYQDPHVKFEATVEQLGYEVAHHEPRSSQLVQRFNRVFRQQDLKPLHKLKTGTSDMNVVAAVWDCPLVAYGPGDSGLDHTPQEHLVIQEFLRAIDFLRIVLESSRSSIG